MYGCPQAEAERKKRAQVLESEGSRDSLINVAEAKKQNMILASEGARQDQINRAIGMYVTLRTLCRGNRHAGEAEAILAKARATAKGLEQISEQIRLHGGMDAAALRVAEQYMEVTSQLC